MRLFGYRISPLFAAVAGIISLSVLICVLVVSCSANTLTFETAFYFVCYSTEDNAVSASSVSNAVSSYGGAGYILEYDGAYYVTVACYYEQKDAEQVCDGLKKRELDCLVLKVETGDYPLNSTSAKTKQLYLGNLNTLQSLSLLAYECANRLDTGEYSQAKAKSVLEDIGSSINGLLNANGDNCFSNDLRRLKAVCNDAGEGYVYSKDIRKLQIAIADTIINIKLY